MIIIIIIFIIIVITSCLESKAQIMNVASKCFLEKKKALPTGRILRDHLLKDIFYKY